MQKILVTLAAILVCVAALSVAEYFGRYLPRAHDAELAEQRRKSDLENAQRCRVDGLAFFGKFYTENNNPSFHYGWDDPEFHYSASLNTCLVHIRYFLGPSRIDGPSYQYNEVLDLYGNRPILFGWFSRTSGEHPEEKTMDTEDSNIPNYTSTQYFTEKNKLFSQ